MSLSQITPFYLPSTQIASHVEPPIANEHRLTKLRPIRTEESGLPAVYVAIMPRLTPGFWIGVETGIRLLVAIEIRVRHSSQYRIVGTRTT